MVARLDCSIYYIYICTTFSHRIYSQNASIDNTSPVNTLRPRQNGHHFANDIFKCIFLNENVWISRKISLKFVPKVRINNNPALVQIMAWRRPGDKPLSEPMMCDSLTHICVTRPQWVKITRHHPYPSFTGKNLYIKHASCLLSIH